MGLLNGYKGGQRDEQITHLQESVDHLNQTINHVDQRLQRLERVYWLAGCFIAVGFGTAPFWTDLVQLVGLI